MDQKNARLANKLYQLTFKAIPQTPKKPSKQREQQQNI
jgi:hypothetical protein